MKRKAFTLTLAAFLLASLAACSNGTNSSKTANETTSAVETSFSENAHSDIIRICQDFLQNNETDETLASILDMDTAVRCCAPRSTASAWAATCIF